MAHASIQAYFEEKQNVYFIIMYLLIMQTQRLHHILTALNKRVDILHLKYKQIVPCLAVDI